jgi:spoIIIJ-associated protein
VQHLAQRIVLGGGPGRGRVVIDAEGYRARRAEALQRQADDAADDALQYKRPVALDAMTAGERRIVHEYLRDRGDVETYSEGEEPDRHLVVAPLSS